MQDKTCMKIFNQQSNATQIHILKISTLPLIESKSNQSVMRILQAYFYMWFKKLLEQIQFLYMSFDLIFYIIIQYDQPFWRKMTLKVAIFGNVLKILELKLS